MYNNKCLNKKKLTATMMASGSDYTITQNLNFINSNKKSQNP